MRSSESANHLVKHFGAYAWNNFRAVQWPLAALTLLFVFNLAYNGSLPLVQIVDNATPVLLVALGMTLVIATGGVDLSVGAIMAICGSTVAVLLTEAQLPLPLALLLTLCVGVSCGIWNGMLVALWRIQPIIATLILMVAGRGIARLIGHGIELKDFPSFVWIARGSFLGLPMTVYVALLAAIAMALLVRRTALGLFIESVGGNEVASRYAGLRVRWIRILVYAFCGLLSGMAGIIASAEVIQADAINTGLFIELDAILAVVIGGTALTGGRFNLLGSVIGALIIQTLNSTIGSTMIAGESIPAEYNEIVKAIVVLAVCLLQSDVLRATLFKLQAKLFKLRVKLLKLRAKLFKRRAN